MTEHTSTELYKASCENCGSSDGLGVYDDGHALLRLQHDATKWRNSCQVTDTGKEERFKQALLPSEAQALPHRRITKSHAGSLATA